MKPGEVLGRMRSIVGNKNDNPKEITEALKEVKSETGNEWIGSFLRKMGAPHSKVNSVQGLWTGVIDILNLSHAKLHNVLINQSTDKDTGVVETDVIAGNAAAAIGKVEQEFRSDFKIANNDNKFIVDTEKVGNKLDTKAVLDKYQNGFKTARDKWQFIRDIGIPLTDNPKIVDGFEGDNISINFIYGKLELLNEKGVTILDVIKELKAVNRIVKADGKVDLIDSQASNIIKILDLEANFSGKYYNVSVMTATGDIAYEYGRMSGKALMIKNINKSKDFNDLISMPEMAHLNPARNPRAAALQLLHSIYYFDKGAGTFTTKIPGQKLTLDLADGTANIVENTFSDKDYSAATSSADIYTRFLEDFYSMFLDGKVTGPTPADKGTVPIVSVNRILTPGEDNNLYIDISPFSKVDPDSRVNLGIQEAYNILVPHLEGELKEIAMIERHQSEPFLDNIKGFTVPSSKKGKTIPASGLEFSMFAGVFQEKTKLDIKEEYEKNGNLRKNAELRSQMLSDLAEYFEFTTEQNKKVIGKLFFVDKNLNAKVLREVQNAKGLTEGSVKNLLLKTYTVNKFIHNLEHVVLFYGGLAQFDAFEKRNPSIDSGGRVPRTDQEALDWINAPIGEGIWGTSRPYQKKRFAAGELGHDFDDFSERLGTAVFAEDVQPSVLYEHYKDNLEKKYKNKIKNKKARTEFIEKKLENYKWMETADAQGYITFDLYRTLGKLTNRWSDQQDALYKKIVNDPKSVTVGEIKEYFPVRKYQYSGPLATEHLHAFAFHKYSLLPLIPTMIENSELKDLHDAMMKNDIGYGVFQSGSKVATVVAEGSKTADQLFLKDGGMNPDVKFTPNYIFVKYLKDQLDINAKSKENVIFSTQLRKLIEEGLVEGGVPLDFMVREFDLDVKIAAWDQFTEEEKLDESKLYTKYKTYEKNLSDVIEFRKAELILEVGSTPEELQAGTGNIEKLIKFIKKELGRQDLTDHELDYIGYSSTGELLNDLSLSPSAGQIEKLLNSIVNNRLIRQKFNGESLVQVSNTMFHARRNTTNEDYKKHGTKDLLSYRVDEDPDSPTFGMTLGMQVKTSMQGSFKHLYKMKHKDKKPIAVYTTRQRQVDGKVVDVKEMNEEASLARLNETIQDPEWLKIAGNRDMITMVGVRIPVQGHNSMEFMVVKVFLPEASGNIIIPPAEIVAKSGSDFDVDKLTIMMPNIDMIGGQPAIIKRKKSKLADNIDFFKNVNRIANIKEKLKELKKEKGNLSKIIQESIKNVEVYAIPHRKALAEVARLTAVIDSLKRVKKPDENNKALQLDLEMKRNDQFDKIEALENDLYEYKSEFDITDEDLNWDEVKEMNKQMSSLKNELGSLSGAAIENDVIFNLRDILELPINFESLITPNDTNIVKDENGIWGKLNKRREYSNKVGAWGEGDFQKTRWLESAYNLYQHQYNSVGKETLGLGAVSNTWNTIFNRVGAYLNPEYKITEFSKEKQRAVILLDHHKRRITSGEYKGQEGISLSHLYGKDGKKISEIISQLMNGWVDVANDSWIFDLQGNKQVTPVIDFLIESGVPFDSVIAFVSNPLVIEYIKEQRIAQSPVSKPNNLNAFSKNEYRTQAKIEMFKKLQMSHDLLEDKDVKNDRDQVIGTKPGINYDELNALTMDMTAGKDFTTSALTLAEEDYATAAASTNARAALLHYMELESISKQIANVKINLNYDTSRSNNLFDSAKVQADLAIIREGNLFPSKIIEDILKESPIGSFNIADFQMKLWGPLFERRNGTNINNFIINALTDRAKVRRMEKRFNTTDKYIETFKNNMLVKIFTDTIKDFNINSPTYKGLSVNIEPNIKEVSHLDRGVAVLPNKKGELIIHIDKETLENQFKNSNEYSKYSKKLKLAPVPTQAFELAKNSKNEYYRFVIEREYQRAMNPFDKLSKTQYFEYRYNKNLKRFDDNGDYTKEERENIILQRTYEEILRDKALNNTLNIWSMFAGNHTIVDQLYEIKEMHPHLQDKYAVVKDLIVSQADMKNAKGETIASYKNTSLRDNRVESKEFNIYYGNMKELSDASNNSIPILPETAEQDQKENKRIADFFSNLPIAGFLQSGLNTKDPISIMRAMPMDKIKEVIASSKPKYDKILSHPVLAKQWLSAYSVMFNEDTNPKKITKRRRMLDYASQKLHIEKPSYNLTAHELPVDHVMPMYLEDGSGNRQMKEEFKGMNTFDLILAGKRTATTRRPSMIPNVKPGDIVEFTKDYEIEELHGTGVQINKHTLSQLVRVTSYAYPIDTISPEEWSDLEGWDESVYFKSVKNNGVQFTYERISDEELAETTKKQFIEINPETTKHMEILLDNNPNVTFVLQKGKAGELDASKFKKYDNVLPLIVDETMEDLENSLDKLENLVNSDTTIGLLSKNKGYSKITAQTLKQMWGAGEAEAHERITSRLYDILEYENVESKSIIKDRIKDVQARNNIVEYALSVSDIQLNEARERLSCKT